MFAFDLNNVYTTVQHLTDLGCELLQTRIPNWTEVTDRWAFAILDL